LELQRSQDELAAHTLSPELDTVATGLLAATGRLLGVSSDAVSAALRKTGGLSIEEHNAELLRDGSDGKRHKRVDKFPLDMVYQYFHLHETEVSPLPDYSLHVRLNKRKHAAG
jgi:hypothetical protein